MAEDTDDSQKTEDPTQKKLDEARKKGQVATSRELMNFFTLFGGALVVIMLSPSVASGVSELVFPFIERPHLIATDGGSLRLVARDLLLGLLGALAVPFLLLVVLAAAGSIVQNGLVVSVERIVPKPEKINPLNGLKQKFSLRTLVEFLRDMLKMVIVGGIITWVVWPELRDIEILPQIELPQLLERLWELVVLMMIALLSALAVIAGLDFAYQKYEFIKSMRMSKQEIKDEMKQSEGDPQVKGRIRQIRMDRARARMMQAVPQADVVVTNPTHFAVALKYDIGNMEAPICVAKGQDRVALKIREVAAANDVSVVENPPVARALYATVEIDQQIPPEHYQAVAKIISYVYKLKGRKFN